jgi:hypothetical protein
MLLRAIVLIAIVAVLSETIVSAAAALGRASLHERELSLVRDGLGSAIESAQQSIATHAIAPPSTRCAYADSHGCAITLQTTITPATAVPETPTCPSGNCTITTQANANVAESRASYSLAVTLLAANGDRLMERNGVVSFRTFDVSPYATLAGSLDVTLDTLMNGGVGDDGGDASTAHGTLVHVLYQQMGGRNAVSADVWRAKQEQPATASQPWVR